MVPLPRGQSGDNRTGEHAQAFDDTSPIPFWHHDPGPDPRITGAPACCPARSITPARSSGESRPYHVCDTKVSSQRRGSRQRRPDRMPRRRPDCGRLGKRWSPPNHRSAPPASPVHGGSLWARTGPRRGSPRRHACEALKRPDRCIVHLAVIKWCVRARASRTMPSEITVGPCPPCQ